MIPTRAQRVYRALDGVMTVSPFINVKVSISKAGRSPLKHRCA
jgi:hypothetical protein